MTQLFKPFVSEAAIAASAEVLRSGWIGLGPRTARFEREFAAYIGCRYAVAVNSATSALHLAAVVSGIGPGDEVLTTPMTFLSTNAAIVYQGAVPVFVDIEPDTLNLDLAKAAALVGPRTKAIFAVHYGGNPLDEERLHAFAAQHGLAVIEDAAHACGATFRGRRIGSFGTTCFSFHAVKNLPLGDGGMVTTDDEALAARLQRLRWMGIDRSTFERNAGAYQWEYEVDELGYKYHMNDIAAAIGCAHLPELDGWNRRRADFVAIYREVLGGLPRERLTFLATTPGAVSAHHLCAVLVADRDRLSARLKERGIGVGVHYKPNHHYPPFRRFARTPLPQCEAAYARQLSLPLHLHLDEAEVRLVATTLRDLIAP
jgi:perosamine synthetase